MLHHKPLTAKLISTTIATVATYFGNRYWTWRHRERSGLHREYVLFFVLNGIGLLIAAGCLGFSRYVLDLHTWLSDNIAANFVGLGLGTLFRFWSYRKFVFKEDSPWTKRNITPPRTPAKSQSSASSFAVQRLGHDLVGGHRSTGITWDALIRFMIICELTSRPPAAR